MPRPLALPLVFALSAMLGCSPGASEQQAATHSALSASSKDTNDSTSADRGDDLAPIADSATAAGDVDGIPFVPATEGSYASGRDNDIKYVVIHDIEGNGQAGVGVFTASGAQVSAHYVIDKFGVAVQMVREADTAWHSGNHHYNNAAIGIEHSGVATEDGYTDAEYVASAKLVASIVTRYNIPVDRTHIISHSQVPATEDETDPCTPDRTDCGGANHHDDPGPHWDYDSYLQKVQAEVDSINAANGP
jgi:N-acetyl-anhydromuramyl-L-alanine amidase AmpD